MGRAGAMSGPSHDWHAWPASAGNGRSRSSLLSLRCERVVPGATRAPAGATRAPAGAHRLDRVAEAHRQRPAGDEGVLLDLFVVVAGALLGVGVGGDLG